MMLRSILRTALVLAATGVLFLPAAIEAKTVFRLANTGGPNDDYTYGCEQFAKNLRDIQGRIRSARDEQRSAWQ